MQASGPVSSSPGPALPVFLAPLAMGIPRLGAEFKQNILYREHPIVVGIFTTYMTIVGLGLFGD